MVKIPFEPDIIVLNFILEILEKDVIMQKDICLSEKDKLREFLEEVMISIGFRKWVVHIRGELRDMPGESFPL